MNSIERDRNKLCENALGYGADRAVPIAAEDIVFDLRVGLKCQVPLCPHYGRSLMCPPNVMPMDQFMKVVAKYQTALIIQFDINPDTESLRAKAFSLSELNADREYSIIMRESQKKMMDILTKTEKDAINMGYRFAAAFAAGDCPLCESCIGPGGQCRHPFMARPSMEAMGIDVIATAEKARVPVDYPAVDSVKWTALLLVD